MELLYNRNSFDDRHMELWSNDCLKSRVRENRTHGSVRGSRQAFHLNTMKGESRLSTRHNTMKTWYLATFKWSDSGVYCTNLVLTDSEEKAEEHYSKYEMVSIRIADEWEVDSYRSRGCPVVEL